jgi:hypothetical protein
MNRRITADTIQEVSSIVWNQERPTSSLRTARARWQMVLQSLSSNQGHAFNLLRKKEITFFIHEMVYVFVKK